MRSIPQAYSGIDLGRGDILETVTGSGRLTSQQTTAQSNPGVAPSSTEFQNRDLDLPAKLLDVDRVAA